MSEQLVISIDQTGERFRWCWLDAKREPDLARTGEGDIEQLANTLPPLPVQAWLIVPGTRVVTRELDYNEKEKKHLRSLLPYQLEETLIGDIDNFHFALGALRQGKVCIAWIEKAWLEAVYERLSDIGIEVTRSWSAPLTLPLIASSADEPLAGVVDDHWTVQLNGNAALVRYASGLGFAIEAAHLPQALNLLLTSQKRVDHLPLLHLRGSAEELEKLAELIPASLVDRVADQQTVNAWQLDYSDKSINLGQGEFSQRLPVERWWRNWRLIAGFAGACLAVHLGIMLYQLHDFRKENIAIRQQIEATYRQVMPQGAYVDAERQLTGLVRELQPTGQSGNVVALLAQIFPHLNNDALIVRNIQYLGDTGDVNMQIQAGEFATIEKLRTDVENQGLNVELLSSSVQGSTHSARLKISAPAR